MASAGGREADIIAQLQGKLNSLARHKAVAQFLLSRFDEAVFLTASQLAKHCRTSESTVIRFARSLGYQGYPDFQRDLQSLLRQKLAGPTEQVHRAGVERQSAEVILDRAMETALRSLRETRKLINVTALQMAAEAIIGAESRYVIGLRASAGIAQLLGFHLRWVLPRVQVQTEGGPILVETLISVKKGDVLVAICFPRYTKWTIEALHYAGKQGARTVVLTDSQLSPAAQVAEICLVARADSITFSNSYLAPMLVVDALVGTVLSLAPRESLARMEALEQALKGQDFFYEWREWTLPGQGRGHQAIE
jgi:DNA-binding MurR/RpiR family transcriptional regulator